MDPVREACVSLGNFDGRLPWVHEVCANANSVGYQRRSGVSFQHFRGGAEKRKLDFRRDGARGTVLIRLRLA